MLKTISYIIIFLISTFCYSQKIKSITEFKKEKDTLIKTRFTKFDKNSNLIKEIRFGGYDKILETYRNYISSFEYKNGRLKYVYTCENFVAKDTCVIRSFSKYQFNPKTETLKQTKYNSDSLIQFIRRTKKYKRKQITKTYSWIFFPVKKPDLEKAIILTDTAFLDRKERITKRVNYNSDFDKPFTELYDYSKNKITYKIKGLERDTIITLPYSKMQKLVDKKKIEYNFKDIGNYSYDIKYY